MTVESAKTKIKSSTPQSKTPQATQQKVDRTMLAKEDETILVCATCRKPLWIIHPIEVLSKFSTEQKEATPIGHKVSLSKLTRTKNPSFTCPLCKGTFAKWDAKLQKAQYFTDKGLI